MESDEYETINSIENWLAGPLTGDPTATSSFSAQPPPVNQYYNVNSGITAGFHYGAESTPHHGLYGAVLGGGGGVSQLQQSGGVSHFQHNAGVSPFHSGVSTHVPHNYHSGLYGGQGAVVGPLPPAGGYGAASYSPTIGRGDGLHVSGRLNLFSIFLCLNFVRPRQYLGSGYGCMWIRIDSAP